MFLKVSIKVRDRIPLLSKFVNWIYVRSEKGYITPFSRYLSLKNKPLWKNIPLVPI